MKEYFITIMSVALVGGIVISFSPSASMAKYMKLLCGLCTVGCVAFPLVGFVNGDFDREAVISLFDAEKTEKEYYDEIYNNNLGNAEINNAEISLKSDIIKELGGNNDDFDLNIITEQKSDEISIIKVEVKIHPSGVYLNPRNIENCIEQRLECECEIFYT